MNQLKQNAENMLHTLERKKRDSGVEFIALKDHAPQWMKDVARRAHGDLLPDDFIYQFIEESLQAIIDSETGYAQDIYMNLETEIYVQPLLLWVSSNLFRVEYVNHALQDFDRRCQTFIDVLQNAQFAERISVCESIIYDLAKLD